MCHINSDSKYHALLYHDRNVELSFCYMWQCLGVSQRNFDLFLTKLSFWWEKRCSFAVKMRAFGHPMVYLEMVEHHNFFLGICLHIQMWKEELWPRILRGDQHYCACHLWVCSNEHVCSIISQINKIFFSFFVSLLNFKMKKKKKR